MVSYMDWMFGQLLAGLEASGLAPRTGVFATSDHGDFGGDFHLVEKWPGGGDDVPQSAANARVPTSRTLPCAMDRGSIKEPYVEKGEKGLKKARRS